MFGNAYQNGPTLEVWDAKGRYYLIQSTSIKIHFTSNCSKVSPVTPPLVTSTKRSRAIFILFKVKMPESLYLLTIINCSHCIKGFWYCISLCRLDFPGQLSLSCQILMAQREEWISQLHRESRRSNTFHLDILLIICKKECGYF